MKAPLPSFKIQILLIVFFLLLISAIFTRSFFIDEFKRYRNNINSLELESKMHNLYQNHHDILQKQEIERLYNFHNISQSADQSAYSPTNCNAKDGKRRFQCAGKRGTFISNK